MDLLLVLFIMASTTHHQTRLVAEAVTSYGPQLGLLSHSKMMINYDTVNNIFMYK